MACFRHGVPVPPAVPVRQTRRPYKLSGFVNRSHLRTRRWRSNTFRTSRTRRTRTSAGLRRRAEWRARRAQIVRVWTPTWIVCAYIFSCFIVGLRIIYVGAFAFELRIFIERQHFAIDADILRRRHFAMDADILPWAPTF